MFGDVIAALEGVKESLDQLPERIAAAIVEAQRKECDCDEGKDAGAEGEDRNAPAA